MDPGMACVRARRCRYASAGLRARGTQRLGLNVGGRAERGLGGCWSRDVVSVRFVADSASWVAGTWSGVCGGSRSRMRHQRAAAGWSSGSGPAAAADRTSWVVSKPARERLLSLSLRAGRNGSAVTPGTSVASSRSDCRSVWVSGGASRVSSCCCQTRPAWPS